ncbi:MAG: biotin--[acetyl-CoA-carboxylase] ligase [Planctomycetota bacterium]
MSIHTEGQVDPEGLRSVQQLLQDGLIGSAQYCQQTQSTNSDAADDDSPTHKLPKLYIADQQRSGRGRHGRTWLSDHGTLTFTLAIELSNHADVVPFPLPLAVGIGIAQAIEFEWAPLRCSLKWPNDVYVAGGKVAGILCETTPRTRGVALIGIGINVATSPDASHLPEDYPVSDLSTATRRCVDRYQVLAPVVRAVLEVVSESRQSDHGLANRFRSRCRLTGTNVRCQQNTEVVHGVCQGISDTGALRLQTVGGPVECHSGTIQ